MPVFEIEEYELHTSKHRVKADTIEDAIKMHRRQESDMVNDSLEYVEIPEDYGMSTDKMVDAGIDIELLEDEDFDMLAGIRDIREVKE